MRVKVQERMVVFPSGDLTLEGLYIKGKVAPGIVVGSPHPGYGGSMDSAAVAEVVFGAARDRHPVLRFNYRGVGASQGPRAQLAGELPAQKIDASALPELEDYRAGIEELRATGGVESIVVAGYSFGSALALAAALSDRDIAGAILVAPATAIFDYSKIPQLRVPTLVVAGTADPWLSLAELDELCEAAPSITFEKIPEANHVFDRGLVAVGHAVQAFMTKLAPG